jgi:hypothetical protein
MTDFIVFSKELATVIIALIWTLAMLLMYNYSYRRYVLGHEKSHRAICLFFGGKAGKLKASLKGGSFICEGGSKKMDVYDLLSDLFAYNQIPVLDAVFLFTYATGAMVILLSMVL